MEMTQENVRPNSHKKSISDSHPDRVTEDRIKSLLWYLRRFGIPDGYLFEIQDLQEMSNIPRVSRCIAMLGKMVSIVYYSIVRFFKERT